jgi:hypothetical protein
LATPVETQAPPGGTTAIVARTPLPPPSDTPVPSAGPGQMWVPVALLLVMTVLMLRRGRV